MARIVPSTLTFSEKRWFTALIKKHQMRSIFLKKRPIFQKNPKQAQECRNSYLEVVAPEYVTESEPKPEGDVDLCHEDCLHKEGEETLHHPDCQNFNFIGIGTPEQMEKFLSNEMSGLEA